MPQPPANVPLTITPGKTIVQKYPTPNLSDRILVRRMDTRLVKNFVPPTPGDALDALDPNSRYEGFIFATAIPSDQGGLVDYYYVNERANQDEYNFATDYPYNTTDFPRITRTYVYLRSTYVEPEVNDTADPVFDTHQLTDHQQLRIENDPVMDSLFVVVQRVFEILPGPVITTLKENEYQQMVTIDTQEVADPTTVDDPTATTEIAQTERTGTAKLKTTKGDTDIIFPATEYAVERNESLIPYVFQSLVPSFTTSQVVEGTVAIPTLAATDWGKSEKQLTIFKKVVKSVTRAFDGTLTLIGYLLTRDQQVATVTETWVQGDQFIEARPTLIDAEVSDWGEAGTFKREVEVLEVFDEAEFSVSIPDPVPAEFRDLAPTRQRALTTAGEPEMPELGVGEIAKSVRATTDLKVRTETTFRDTTELPVERTGRETSEVFGFGGVLEVTRTLDDSPLAIEEGINVVSSKTEEIGTGLYLKETKKLPDGGDELILTAGGSGYTCNPDVVFDGDGGIGGGAATAHITSEVTEDVEVDLDYEYNGDDNGVFYYLGKHGNGGVWQNPQTNGDIEITAPFGALEFGTFDQIVDRHKSNVYLETQDNAMLYFDLGAGRLLECNHLTYQQRKDFNSPCRELHMQGSIDGTPGTWSSPTIFTVSGTDPGIWKQVPVSNDDAGDAPYRWFRLYVPVGDDFLSIGDFELYGTLTLVAEESGGSVTGVTITNAGEYVTAPDVEFDNTGTGGTGAAGTAVLSGTGLVDITITNPGSDYVTPPLISFTGGVGSAPTATSQVGYGIASIAVGANGSDYVHAPAVILSGGGGNGGGAAVAELAYGIGSVHITNNGTSYETNPDVEFDGDGTGAEGTAVRGFPVVSATVTEPGSGYASPPTVTISGGGGSGAGATATLGYPVESIEVTDGGLYVTNPTVTLSAPGGPGDTATATATLGFEVYFIGLSDKGDGYTTLPAVTISGDGTGATAEATHFAVTGVTVTNGGTGYSVGNVLTVVGGTGTAATLTVSAQTGGVITAVTISSDGHYTVLPTNPVSVTGGGGSAATFTLTYGIDEIAVTDGGSGYTVVPDVLVDPPTGTAPVFLTSDDVGGPTYAWTSISGTGTELTDLLDDDAVQEFDLTNFSFPFMGGTYTAIVVATNGFISLQSGVTNSFGGFDQGGPFPFGFDDVSPIISPLGCDHIINDGVYTAGHVYMQEYSDHLIIEWNTATLYDDPTAVLTYQCRLNSDGTILFTYNTLTNYENASVIDVGCENEDADVGLSISHNTYDLDDAFAILISPGPGAEAYADLADTGPFSGTIKFITVTDGGSCYLTAPTVTITGGSGSGGDAEATLSDEGNVRSITIVNNGSKFTSAPTISFSGSGSDAAATAVLGTTGVVIGVTITDPGEGYSEATVEFSGGGGLNAAGFPILSTTGYVKSIEVTAPGAYVTTPTVSFTGGSGSGATATATLETTGSVISVTLTSTNDYYLVAPEVSFEGCDGDGAAATYSILSDAWPVLYGDDTDPQTGIVIGHVKRMVPAGTRYPGILASVGDFINISPLDKWRSIQISSRVDLSTLPPSITFGTSQDHSFPDTLLSIEAVWADGASNLAAAEAESAAVKVGSGSTGDIIVTLLHGYRGRCHAELTRFYRFGPPTLLDVPLPDIIQTVTGSAVLFSKETNTNASVGDDGANSNGQGWQNQARSITIPDVLTGSYEIIGESHYSPAISAYAQSGGGGVIGLDALGTQSTMEVSIPISDPVSLESGQSILVSTNVEQWRFGIWVVELLRVFVP